MGGGWKGKSEGMPGRGGSEVGGFSLLLVVFVLLVVCFLGFARGEVGMDSGICARGVLGRCGTRGDFGVCGRALGVGGLEW